MFLSDPAITAFPWLAPKKGKHFFKKEEAAIHIAGLLNHHYAVQLTKSHEQQGNTEELLF